MEMNDTIKARNKWSVREEFNSVENIWRIESSERGVYKNKVSQIKYHKDDKFIAYKSYKSKTREE